MELDTIGYTLRAGHRLCLSLSPVYWPMIWTPRKNTRLQVGGITLTLPQVPKDVNRGVAHLGEHWERQEQYGPAIGKKKRVQLHDMSSKQISCNSSPKYKEKNEIRPASFDRRIDIGLSDDIRTLKLNVDSGR